MSNSLGQYNDIVVSDSVPDPPRWSDKDITGEKKILTEDQILQGSTFDQFKAFPKTEKDNSSTRNSASNSKSANSDPNIESRVNSEPRKSNIETTTINISHSANIKIGSTTKHIYNLNNFQNNNCSSTRKASQCTSDDTAKAPKQMPTHIQALKDCKLEITRDDILLVKDYLGSRWRETVKLIGFPKARMEQLIEKYSQKGPAEIIYRILIEWKQTNTTNATVGHLINAMWSSQQYDCAERLTASHLKFNII